MMKLGYLASLVAIGAALGGAAQAAAPDSRELTVTLTRTPVKLISNVVFAQPSMRGYDNVALRMDVLKPTAAKPLPAVVFITGGGFVNANKDSYIQQRLDLAQAGYVVASIEYRVAPTAMFPAPLIDVKSAIRFLRANAARFGIDAGHIGVLGESAGGYLSAFAGVSNGDRRFDQGEHLDQSSAVQAAVDLYGLSDLNRVGEGFSEAVQAQHRSPSAPEAMWVNGPAVLGTGGAISSDPARAEAANPVAYVSKTAAPFLLMHGDHDTLVSPRQTERLFVALRGLGVDATRYVVKGAAHGGEYWIQPPVMQTIIAFLDRHLKP
ncbi:alpha/beta hydrolase [Paludibacterium yongneupense]|uniref:alpha/beta hydrolase n=1 Tax=Paludibacterium yongneupense TaxID=400061 RepID=UPI001B7FBC38|nr:alpha/beta hydrolase [Paludibacterium yongneupense]